MRVLVSWGSKLGGTEGIARIIGEEIERGGSEVVLLSAAELQNVRGYDAAVIGGALYANRWHPAAYRLVTRNVTALRHIPVWLFSSGPLDASADSGTMPPPTQVAVLMERIGAQGHAMFGGRMPADAKGFPAAAMAKKSSGDWRNPDRITGWAADIAQLLPKARPRPAVDFPARSLWRLAAHGVAGWAICAVLMAGLLQLFSTGIAVAIHAVAAPLIFAAVAVSYFGARGAREPLPAALAFAAIVALLDAAIVAGLILRSFAMFESVVGTWLPFLLIFLATWATGLVMSMIPVRRGPPRAGVSGSGIGGAPGAPTQVASGA
jgi:menaquinone-dependent protoporphyrinogen oxidase